MIVTLFKSSSVSESDNHDTNDDKFLRALREEGNFTGKIIPVVAFEFRSLEILWRELQEPEHLHGIIFTSPRCVESIRRAVDQGFRDEWESHLRDEWIRRPMYCVGPATRDAVRGLFGHSSSQEEMILVSEKGNSESLAHKIIQESQRSPIERPLLYPCGSLKTDTLGSMLSKGGVPWKAVTVYETVQNPELERKLSEGTGAPKTEEEEEEVYVFFSPSGLRFALPYLKDLNKKKFVALGPTTREALEKTPTIPTANIYQCDSPTPDALVTLLKSVGR